MTMPSSRLADVQRWMFEAITRSGIPSSTAVEALLPSQRLSVEERLGVYQSAYLARLGECLRGEFPAVAAAVGDDAFNEFTVAYVDRHPPASYTLAELGCRFSAFLAELRPPQTDTNPDFGDFLVELAKYERTIAEVFDAEGPETDPLPVEQRLAITDAAAFATGRLEFYPCVRLLKCQFPVHEYRSAIRRNEAPSVSEPRSVRLLISRQDYVVRRWEIPDWQFDLLTSLLAGQTIEQALESIALANTETVTPEALQQAFQEWTARTVIKRWVATQAGP